ncbi:MAG TPA: hypothetical protein VFX89_19755 [Gammaproteobacteria bacterium]|nr:hypothetical protein [Gammaproteobacteria bacterium]
MRILLRLLTDLLWPPRREWRASRTLLDVYSRPLLLLLVAVLVGPDLFAFVEVSTLLELLGATMFIVAFSAGGRLVVATWLERLRSLLLPAEFAWLFAIPGRRSAKVFGSLFVARNGLALLMIGVVAYVAIAMVVEMAV